MIKIYTGDLYRARSKVEKLVKDLDEMNQSRFDELSKEVFETAYACPFLSDRRVVIVNIDTLSDSQELMKYIENPALQTDLYLFVRKTDKRTKLYKVLCSKGLVEESEKFTRTNLNVWVTNFLGKCGKKISKDMVDYFIERTQYLLEDNIEFCVVEGYVRQLSFIPVEEVTKKEIDELVPETASLKIFYLSDLLLEGSKKELFVYADRLLEQEEEPIALLSLLERTFRIAYKATLFADKPSIIGVSEQQYKKALKYNPEILNEALDLLQEGVHMLKTDIDRRVVFIHTLLKVWILLHEKQ